MTPPRVLAVLRCSVCSAVREVDESSLPQDAGLFPECGQVFTDRSRFPDGSWVNVEQYTPHGPMSDTGERLEGNPFQSMVDEEPCLRPGASRVREVIPGEG